MTLNGSNMKGLYIMSSTVFLYVLSVILFDTKEFIKYLYAANVGMALVYAALKLFNGSLRVRLGAFVFGYLLLTFFGLMSVIWANSQSFAMTRLVTMTLILLNSIIIYNLLLDYKTVEPIFHGVIIGLLVNLLVAFGIFNIGWEVNEGWRFKGTTLKSNLLANICIFGVVCALYFNEKKFLLYRLYGYVGLLTALYISFLTASKKGIIASLFILIVYLMMKKQRAKSMLEFGAVVGCLFVAASLFNVIGIVTDSSVLDLIYLQEKLVNRFNVFIESFSGQGSDRSTQNRVLLVAQALDFWLKNPLLGQGLGAFEAKHGAYAHNNFADLLANLGLIGFVMYYRLYLNIGVNFIKAKYKDNISYLFAAFLLILLISELAIVTYQNKVLMMFLLVTSFMLEQRRLKPI